MVTPSLPSFLSEPSSHLEQYLQQVDWLHCRKGRMIPCELDATGSGVQCQDNNCAYEEEQDPILLTIHIHSYYRMEAYTKSFFLREIGERVYFSTGSHVLGFFFQVKIRKKNPGRPGLRVSVAVLPHPARRLTSLVSLSEARSAAQPAQERGKRVQLELPRLLAEALPLLRPQLSGQGGPPRTLRQRRSRVKRGKSKDSVPVSTFYLQTSPLPPPPHADEQHRKH